MSTTDPTNGQSAIGDGGDLTFNIYGYTPSVAAGIAFTVIFALLTGAHLFQVVRSRLWWYSVMVVGGVSQVIGWGGGRTWSAYNVYSLNAFLIQQILLILSPCFFSACCYGTLGMLIRSLGLEYSRLRPALYLWIFCIADLIAIVVQAVGGAMSALALQNDESSQTGTNIMVAGIVAQMAAMFAFAGLAADFYWRAGKAGAIRSLEGGNVPRLALGLAFATVFILIRCVYRTVELAQGWEGYLITHEPYFLALDSVPMVLTMLAFNLAHPSNCLPDYRNLTRTVGADIPPSEKKEEAAMPAATV